MNRHERRAAEVRQRKAVGRAEAIRLTNEYLAHQAAATVTGATLILPDGDRLFLSANDARTMAGRLPARGRA
jgi:hypothetical protein